MYIYICPYVPMYLHVFMSLSIRRPKRQFRQIRKSFKELSIRKDFGVKRSVSAVMMCVCVCVCVCGRVRKLTQHFLRYLHVCGYCPYTFISNQNPLLNCDVIFTST